MRKTTFPKVLELRVHQQMQQGVYCIEEVQHARRFIEQLRKGGDSNLVDQNSSIL